MVYTKEIKARLALLIKDEEERFDKYIKSSIASGNLITGNRYSCVDGDWENAILKWNPEHTDSSKYCEATQCYAGDGTEAAKKTCIEANTPKPNSDDYCEGIYDASNNLVGAEWTSRTKKIALQFLKFVNVNAQSKYTLYCDSPENTLNNPSGITGTNNFCILKYGNNNKIALGTTLNADKSTFISKLPSGIPNCNDVSGNPTKNDGQFYECTNNAIWFNPSLNGVVYAKDTITLTGVDWWNAFVNFLRGLFGVRGASASPENIAFVNKQSFNRLYIYDGGAKKVIGIVGKEDGNEILYVEYIGFTTDICAPINKAYPGICASNKVVINDYETFKNQNQQDIWQDLTSKLRIK